MEKVTNYKALEEFEKIILQHQDQLFRFAFFRTGSPADAEDIVQDVFIKVFKTIKTPAEIQNIKSYLFRSIANACNDFQKKKKYKQITSINNQADDNLTEIDASRDLLMREEYTRIENILMTLPAEQAEVVKLRILDELSFREIADIKSEPVTTIKSRFKYGINKLKQIIQVKKTNYELR